MKLIIIDGKKEIYIQIIIQKYSKTRCYSKKTQKIVIDIV